MPITLSPGQDLLAIDWGTSSLRGARLAPDGHVREERALPRGILSVPPGGFPEVFRQAFGDWAATAGLCLVSGMAGSRQGWQEAPYCACPAGFAELARGLAWIGGAPLPLAIVPGLSCENDGLPDVMRGEEIQIFGALRLTGQANGSFVLPGTHSKWADVHAGQVRGFRSFMTGEVYALLREHSILARSLNAEAAFDRGWFVRGVERAGDAGGLLHHAFVARAQSLFGRLDADALPSYLSGLVIGAELHATRPPAGTTVVLIGSGTLTERYALALEALGVPSQALGAEATWAGLHALAQTLEHMP